MSLEVSGVTAGYGDITVLRDVSLRMEDGQVLGILGRNGMGKTTLIRTLAGLIPPSRGIVRFEGRDITRLSSYRRARMGITTVVQGRGIFPRLTVREHLRMGQVAGGSARRDRFHEVIDYFPRLGERLNQPAGTLSGGEQQMLAIGTGLMTDPKLMLLDEPSDGIMPTLVRQIAERLKEINRREGMSVVIVEQNVPMVFGMADYCIVMENGAVVAQGSNETIGNIDWIRQYLAL
ncbi:MAG: ABC transporter ATP-binding protein [Gammaproteobacteria bacterium]